MFKGFVLQEWIFLIMSAWKIVEDGKFNYEDKETARRAVKDGVAKLLPPVGEKPILVGHYMTLVDELIEIIFHYMKKVPDTIQ